MTRTRPSCAAAALLLLLCSCTPTQVYVEADRATYEAIAPAHTRYVAADASLSPEQRQDRRDLLDTWRKRIEAAEGPSSRPVR